MRRPLFQTVSPNAAATTDDEDLAEAVREAPDVSHVAPPTAELPATRDEALELLAQRIDVIATRSDRLERSVEKLSPVHIADMPTRADVRAIEALTASSRERAELLERRLAELREGETAAQHAREADRASVAELGVIVARLEAKLATVTEELIERRADRDASADALRELREAVLENDAQRSAGFSRRLAGAYTVSFVALLAAIVTLALLLTR